MSKITEWPTVCIKDVCQSIVDCVNKTAPTVDYQTPYKMIRTTNVKNGWVDLDEVRCVEADTFARWNRRTTPRKGDVILTREAPLGEVGMLRSDDHVFLGQRLVMYRADPGKLDNSFLLYSFRSDYLQGQIKSLGSGATVEHMRVPDAEKLLLRLPSLPIQKRVGAILSSCDDLIENNTRRIKILEEMAQMIYREWFVNFRFPGHQKVQMVQSPTGAIPSGWKSEPLENVCERITDGSHWSPQSVDTGLPMASVKDMHNWGLQLSTCRKISAEDFETLVRNDCKPLAGDVLIAKDGSYLKHCFWVQKPMEVVILSSIAILRPNKTITSSFLSLHLLDPQVKSRMAGYVSGVAIPRIVLKDFRKFRVLVPPPSIQETFSRLVEPMLRSCECLTERNSVLRQTRDFLLPKLIGGEINANNFEREGIAQGV